MNLAAADAGAREGHEPAARVVVVAAARVDARSAADYLADCIARTRKNQAKLLLVLAHPE